MPSPSAGRKPDGQEGQVLAALEGLVAWWRGAWFDYVNSYVVELDHQAKQSLASTCRQEAGRAGGAGAGGAGGAGGGGAAGGAGPPVAAGGAGAGALPLCRTPRAAADGGGQPGTSSKQASLSSAMGWTCTPSGGRAMWLAGGAWTCSSMRSLRETETCHSLQPSEK